MASDPWFEAVPADRPLTQGDLIPDCPLFGLTPDADLAALAAAGQAALPGAAQVFRDDVIVMTQACDLEHGKVASVVLCPCVPLAEYRAAWEDWMRGRGQTPSEKSWRRNCEDIAAGYVWNLTLLDRFAGTDAATGVRVVDFHEVYTAPRVSLDSLLRARGRPPGCNSGRRTGSTCPRRSPGSSCGSGCPSRSPPSGTRRAANERKSYSDCPLIPRRPARILCRDPVVKEGGHMGRTAAYHVRLDDGREVGFGLVVRDEAGTYSAQFRDVDGKKYVIRSTGERSRPRAIAAAERIVKEHYQPPERAAPRQTTWDELLAELRTHLTADGARPATVSDYLDTIRQVRSAAVAPAALSAGLAQLWCNDYLGGTFTRAKGEGAKTYARSPRTLHARVRKLRAIWGKYLVKRLRVADENPWETVDLPKLDKLPVRTLSADQVAAFFDWLTERWRGWELPTLFFETKAVTGCRLGDLCGVRTKDLKDGKLYFTADTTKARKQRVAVLPDDLYKSLKRLAGRTYLWESYARDLPTYLTRRGVPTHRIVPVFDPQRLNWWAKDEVDDFNKAHPDQPKLKSHDFRKRAVTEAHRAGLDVDTAAAAVGMSPATARAYYLAIDQEKASATLTAKLAGTLRPGKSAGA